MSLEAAIEKHTAQLESLEKTNMKLIAIMEKVHDGQTRNLEAIENMSSGAKPSGKAASTKAAPAKKETAKKAETKPEPKQENPYAGEDGFEEFKKLCVSWAKDSSVEEDERTHRSEVFKRFLEKHDAKKITQLDDAQRLQVAGAIKEQIAEFEAKSGDKSEDDDNDPLG